MSFQRICHGGEINKKSDHNVQHGTHPPAHDIFFQQIPPPLPPFQVLQRVLQASVEGNISLSSQQKTFNCRRATYPTPPHRPPTYLYSLTPPFFLLILCITTSLVNGEQISKIRQGLCVLIGLSIDDTPADLDFMVKKLLSVRVFDSNQHALHSPGTTMIRPPREQKEKTTQADEEVQGEEVEEPARMWAKSVVDIEGEILCGKVSTLLFSSGIVIPLSI